MMEKSTRLLNYDNKYFEAFNFTIKSDDYYIYRYFDSYSKLKDFLTNGIHMSRATEFSDGMECIDYDLINKVRALYESRNIHFSERFNSINEQTYNLDDISQDIQKIQKQYFISCWYLPDKKHENELMWRSYGNFRNIKREAKDYLNYGFLVSIKLKDFLKHISDVALIQTDKHKILYGIVKYFDFNSPKTVTKLKYKAFRKHNSYSDERELRLVVKNYKEEKKSFFINLSERFYNDIKLYMSPRASYDEYNNASDYILLKHNLNLFQSELSLGYAIHNQIKNKGNF